MPFRSLPAKAGTGRKVVMTAAALLMGTALIIPVSATGAMRDQSGSTHCSTPSEKRQGKDSQTPHSVQRPGNCADVLTPPPTGDHELVEPAPDVGTMPVIPPKASPKQQEKNRRD
ncbi:hypothetical protein NAC44_17205 [Allorhizobium sp. BGMRC 0089]|uniref:hypothetical protein n=1 Tax=Allorhizobium sonneratiae TaxID=2934936 RepID=UPI002033990B|nr:hypothetical protein [Allorhizobium sonneratiae]MCM2294067.1 hypothetical protein [Allorhizobium sonneratiae]